MFNLDNLQPNRPFKSSDFRPRSQLGEAKNYVPKPNEHRLIIRPNKFCLGFSTENYNASFLHNITPEEYHKTIQKCNYRCTLSWRNFRKETTCHKYYYDNYLLKASLPFIFLVFCIMIYCIHEYIDYIDYVFYIFSCTLSFC